jgi:hypothetical protein
MKTFVRKIFAGSAIRLAVLSVLFLGMAGACMAQASAARPAAKAAVAPQAQPAAQTGRTHAAKGTHEGIKVHGHWTIEVKNPDGKLVTHREFENSLTTSGGPLLSALLGRTVTTGSWGVYLTDSQQDYFILVVEPNSYLSAHCTVFAPSGVEVGSSCSANLALAAPQPTSPGSSVLTQIPITFTGSATVPSGFPASIGYVETVNYFCFDTTTPITPQSCDSFTGTLPSVALTTRTLDGQNGDPAAVPVSAGQSVSVTVVISFQ